MRSLEIEEGILVALTAVFAVIGLAFACVGIWCFADFSTLLGYANAIYYNSVGASLFGLQPGWTLVPCGFLGVIPIVIVLLATCQPSKGFLIFFIVYICVLLLVELPMTVVVLASWPTTSSTLKAAMETSLKDDYVGLPYSYTHNTANSILFDKLMVNNKCCGINSKTDFTVNFNTYASVWYTGYRSHTLGNGTGYTTTIPSACCMYNNPSTMVDNNDWLNYRNYLVNQLCPVDQTNSYSNGCYDTVSGYAYNVISVTMGCYLIAIVLHIAALVAAGFVYYSVHYNSTAADWTDYTGRGSRKVQPQRGGRRGRAGGRANDENGDGPYRGRAPRGNNKNGYGDGWGANGVYGT